MLHPDLPSASLTFLYKELVEGGCKAEGRRQEAGGSKGRRLGREAF
ncbi:MAG: hypothetical protein F6K47_01405 [Symploca sp. SIO2E6]|nr:hypothetical protein [Symploca sp. SIO2E6]